VLCTHAKVDASESVCVSPHFHSSTLHTHIYHTHVAHTREVHTHVSHTCTCADGIELLLASHTRLFGHLSGLSKIAVHVCVCVCMCVCARV